MVKFMDNLPLWAKIILALPGLDLIWAIYRLVKGITKNKVSAIIGGIVWILLGWAILWLIDLICILIYKKPVVLA
ncbi:MAG: hypothetical protein ACI4L6_02450 [Candidatus Onthoplasma sp.]